MILFTDIISKPVLCLPSAATLGTVENAVFDKKLARIKYFCVFDNESGCVKFLAAAAVVCAGGNAVTVKSAQYFEGETAINSPLKAPLYDCGGCEAGIVEDIALDDAFKVLYLKCGGEEIKPCDIVSFSHNAAVYCKNGEIPDYIKKIIKSGSGRKKSGGEKENTAPEQKAKPSNIYDDLGSIKDGRYIRLNNIVPPYNYLIGRKTTADIYDGIGRLIVKKNGIVTEKTIDGCRKTGRLLMLAKNSVKV